MTLEERLLRQIVKQADGCWHWSGPRNSHGYGLINAAGKSYTAHRLAHKVWLGSIPQGYWVKHRCGDVLCCNPTHLYLNAGRARLEERLLAKLDKQKSGCWIWRGHAENGYGRIGLAGHQRQVVHRVASSLWVEPVPDGLQIQHLCDDRRCCNPQHLVAGTASENVQYLIECRRNSKATGRSIASGG
jgi:hypothetical protein